MIDLFRYDDYKQYLNDCLDERGRGSRSRLSSAISCQTAYTAQVLKGQSHFSLEQGEAINGFLSHSNEEATFFLSLLQYGRAGTVNLRRRFETQLAQLKEARLLLKNRLAIKDTLDNESKATYYSSWIYAATHALASIPRFNGVQEIASELSADEAVVVKVLHFLIEQGLLRELKGKSSFRLAAGHTTIHLPSDSSFISKHHLNWRLRAMQSLEKEKPQNLHYSSVISISEKDSDLIRERLVREIQQIKEIVRESKDECLRSFCLDFFSPTR